MVVWQVCTLVKHPGKVSLVAFSPDGKRIVSGSIFYNVLQIWNAETRAEVSFSFSFFITLEPRVE